MADEFTEEDVAVVAGALWKGIQEDFPRAGPTPTPTCFADGRTVLRALVAAGWRRVPTRVDEQPTEEETPSGDA